MTVDAAVAAAFDRVAARERETETAFAPALPENAYAVVSDGRGGSLYTRDGEFSMRDGRIVDATGRAVLGTTAPNGPLRALQVDPVDLALGRADGLEIGADGEVSYRRATIDPASGARRDEAVRVGRIALARFPFATALRPVDATHALAPDGVAPHLGSAGDGAFGPLFAPRAVGDLDASLQRLREAYLALDALRAAEHASGAVEKDAMDVVK